MSGTTSILFEYHHITSITTRQWAQDMDAFLKEESLDNTMISERHFKKRYCWPVYNSSGAGASEPINQDKEEIVNLSHFPTAPLDKTHGTVTSELRKRKEAKIYIYITVEALRYLSKSHSTIYTRTYYTSHLNWSVCSGHPAGMSQGLRGGLGCGWVMSHEDWM